ncbi:MAG: sugar transferase [Proteobacteria bacterium]|nr:sugar transferase [Desulfobacula sp.]MBU4130209.1 sugar transferase [Pseudomonadota bacterium]
MLRENHKIIVQFQRAADLLITAACFVMAYFIKRNILPTKLAGLTTNPNYYIVLLAIIIIWYISFNWFGIYRSFREHPFSWFFVNIVKACLAGLLVLNICLFMFHIRDMSRLLLGIFFVLNVSCLVAFKWGVMMVLQRIRAHGFNTRNVLIVGTRVRAESLIKSIDEDKEGGYHILGCFDTDPSKVGTAVINGYKVLGTMDMLRAYLEENVVDELIFAMPLRKIEDADKYIVMAESMGVRVRIIPDWQLHYLAYAPDVASIRISEFSGVQTLTLQSTPLNEGMLMIKAILDYGLAFIFVLVFLPVFILISLAILIVSPGPVLYRQERLGRNGRRFNVLKFRTMVMDADKRLDELRDMNEADGPAFKIKNDPRIIPWVGTFLRKVSLDELPQLFNVLKGDMSLVGPRPPIPGEVDEYEIWQRRRLSMKPGLTCFWQIAPRRNELSFDEWMKLDLEYIDKWSLQLDFLLLLKTAGAVLTGSGR